MTRKTGRTFWDWMHEDEFAPFLALLALMMIMGTLIEVFG